MSTAQALYCDKFDLSSFKLGWFFNDASHNLVTLG
jgi:hypothetical protein